jgi:hypothetical protein
MYQHDFFASSLISLENLHMHLPLHLTKFLRTRQRTQHLLLPKLLHLKPTHPIIPINIPATNPPLPCKATPPVQHPPIIKHHHSPRRQLLPILILAALQQRIKLARRRVPSADLLNRHLHARAVRRVPTYTQQLPSGGIVLKHREPAVRHDTNPLIPRRVSVHINRAEKLIRLWIGLAQVGGDFKPVDEQAGAAGAVGVGEQVEGLQPCRVGEVGVVGVGLEGDVGVRRVVRGQVSGEVVEAAVVGFADEGDALEEGFCWARGGGGRVVDVAEAVLALGMCVSIVDGLMLEGLLGCLRLR